MRLVLFVFLFLTAVNLILGMESRYYGCSHYLSLAWKVRLKELNLLSKFTSYYIKELDLSISFVYMALVSLKVSALSLSTPCADRVDLLLPTKTCRFLVTGGSYTPHVSDFWLHGYQGL